MAIDSATVRFGDSTDYLKRTQPFWISENHQLLYCDHAHNHNKVVGDIQREIWRLLWKVEEMLGKVFEVTNRDLSKVLKHHFLREATFSLISNGWIIYGCTT